MADRWTLRGVEYVNCICNWGCPCQFGAPSTHGYCQALVTGHIDEGTFNDTKLDGLDWVLLMAWPGEIPQGNGKQQAIIDERADPDQREALRKILHGESTTPGGDALLRLQQHDVDGAGHAVRTDRAVDRRRSSNGQREDRRTCRIGRRAHHQRLHRRASEGRNQSSNGFEYTLAEKGNGNTKVRAGIDLDFEDTYGQFNVLHMNQDGVIR